MFEYSASVFKQVARYRAHKYAFVVSNNESALPTMRLRSQARLYFGEFECSQYLITNIFLIKSTKILKNFNMCTK